MTRDEQSAHLSFIRLLPCMVCGAYGTQAAHIRYTDRRFGKTNPGIGRKPDDRWAMPLCQKHHYEQHQRGDERAWWRSHNRDPDSKRSPLITALALWGATGNGELGELIIKEAREQ